MVSCSKRLRKREKGKQVSSDNDAPEFVILTEFVRHFVEFGALGEVEGGGGLNVSDHSHTF